MMYMNIFADEKIIQINRHRYDFSITIKGAMGSMDFDMVGKL